MRSVVLVYLLVSQFRSRLSAFQRSRVVRVAPRALSDTRRNKMAAWQNTSTRLAPAVLLALLFFSWGVEAKKAKAPRAAAEFEMPRAPKTAAEVMGSMTTQVPHTSTRSNIKPPRRRARKKLAQGSLPSSPNPPLFPSNAPINPAACTARRANFFPLSFGSSAHSNSPHSKK